MKRLRDSPGPVWAPEPSAVDTTPHGHAPSLAPGVTPAWTGAPRPVCRRRRHLACVSLSVTRTAHAPPPP